MYPELQYQQALLPLPQGAHTHPRTHTHTHTSVLGGGSSLDTELFHGNNLQASSQGFLWRPALKSAYCLSQHQSLYTEEKEIRGLIFFFFF